MPDPENSVTQVASEATGEQAQAAAAPDVNQVVSEQGVDSAASQQIPLERFQKVNNERKQYLEEANSLRAQIQVLQANQTKSEPTQPESDYMRAVRELGYEGNTYLTVEENAKVVDRMQHYVSDRNQKNASRASQEQFIRSHSDFIEIVGSSRYNPYTQQNEFIPSENMRNMLREKPELEQAIATSANPSLLAYEFAKTYSEKSAAQSVQTAVNQANSISNVQGQNGVIDKAAQMKAMTDEEFSRYKAGVTARSG